MFLTKSEVSVGQQPTVLAISVVPVLNIRTAILGNSDRGCRELTLPNFRAVVVMVFPEAQACCQRGLQKTPGLCLPAPQIPNTPHRDLADEPLLLRGP